jgi:hypothetical protein
MKRVKFVLSLLVILIALSAGADAFFFGNLFVVSGTIQFRGRPADKGVPLSAYIGEEKICESQTKDNGIFELQIPEFDPAKPEVKGYHSADDVIQVKLDGRNAKPTFTPSGDNLKIDLRVETTLDVKLSTWGKIKALFK